MRVHADRKPCPRQSKRIVLSMDNGRSGVPDRSRTVDFLQSGAKEQTMMTHRGIAMRECIGRLECDGALKKRQCSGNLLRHTCINVRLGLKHKIVGIETLWTLSPDALNFRFSYARSNRAYRGQRYLILKRKNVFGAAVVALGPYMHTGRCIDHLPGNAYVTACLAHT